MESCDMGRGFNLTNIEINDGLPCDASKTMPRRGHYEEIMNRRGISTASMAQFVVTGRLHVRSSTLSHSARAVVSLGGPQRCGVVIEMCLGIGLGSHKWRHLKHFSPRHQRS